MDGATLGSETIPDGTHFTAGQSFVKRWTMKNTGTTTWTKGESYLWTFDGGEQFGAATQILLPDGSSVAPGASHDWDVTMTAPATPGSYKGFWRMDHFGTARFGDRVWIDIVVDALPDNDGSGQVDAGPDAGPDSSDAAGTDAGPDSSLDSGADRGVSRDGGSDAGAAPDGPTDQRAGENMITGGCGCGEATPTGGSAMEFLTLLGLSGFLVRRRRTAPATSAGSPHPPRHPGCARPGR